jgi:hypothetical protein
MGQRIGEIKAAMKSGAVTTAQISELADLKDEVVVLTDKIGEIGQKVLDGDPAPHLRKV